MCLNTPITQIQKVYLITNVIFSRIVYIPSDCIHKIMNQPNQCWHIIKAQNVFFSLTKLFLPEGYIFSSHVLTFTNYTVLGRNWTLLEKFQTAYVDYCCNKLICGDTGTHTVKFCNVDTGQNKLRLGSITYQLCFRNEYDLIVCLCLSVCECVFNKLSFFFF